MKKARSILAYAESGDTKTTQGYLLAKWVYEKLGKKTRWISADGAGFGVLDDTGMIEAGIVEAFDISNRKRALADIHRLADGYWPKVIKVENGKLMRLFQNVQECETTKKEWEEIGAYVIEGPPSIGRLLLTHIASNSEKVAFKKGYEYEEDGYIFGGLDKGHYGLVQTELHRVMVQGFNLLPVDYVYYTATVGKGEDKVTKETVYGPRGVGNAITTELPTWVGDCIHLARERVVIQEQDKEIVVAWFQRHPDRETGAEYLAKSRLPPEQFPKLLKKYPYGFIPMNYERGLTDYLEILKFFQEKSKKEGVEWKERIDRERSG